MMRKLVLVYFFMGSILGLLPVLTGNGPPNVVPVDSNWVEEGSLWMPSNAN